MENNEISEHLVRIFKVVRDRNGWMSARDVAVAANVSGRTARAHCLGLVRLGIFDQAEVFPGELDGLLPRPEQVKPHNDVLIRVRVISDTGKAYKVALATLATGIGSTWLPRRWRVPGSAVEEFRIPAWAWAQKRADLLGNNTAA
jgi:hypothetical protein